MLSEEEMMIFELALLLHMPVYKMMDEMPYDEFLGWFDYFKRKPPGWREDSRTAMTMMASGANIVPESVFPSLAQMKTHQDASNKLADTLRQSVFFKAMLNSTGDKPAFLNG
jgi:hypothetical protein